MECELCGRSAQLVRAEIEGTLLHVCDSCARLGRRTDVQPVQLEIREKKPKEPVISSINPGFAKTVSSARKSLAISLEDLGRKINEKASVLDRVEKGMRPTDALARKLEKTLKIKLLGFEE